MMVLFVHTSGLFSGSATCRMFEVGLSSLSMLGHPRRGRRN
jgi:hypothetical protein